MTEWISVEDRLPPFYEDVLVCLIDKFGCSIDIACLCKDVNGSPCFSYRGIGGGPQYWMPLPAPPEGEND
jgi:hypothetical protein